jgi:hypothetical protein
MGGEHGVDDLAGVFHRLYSAFRHWSDGQELAA